MPRTNTRSIVTSPARRAGGPAQSSDRRSRISSGMSKLAQTFCTSSWSSSSSRAGAPASRSTRRPPRPVESAPSRPRPSRRGRRPRPSAARSSRGPSARCVTIHSSPSSRRSSAPASSATAMRSSSPTDLGDRDDALALELPRDRARLGHRAAVAREHRAHLGAGPVAVVGEALDDDRHAGGGVALVGDRLVAHALELAGAPLDRPLDRVERHGGVPGLLEHRAQRGVRVRCRRRPPGRRPRPGGSAWRTACPAPCPSAPFLVLGRRPLRMPRHVVNLPRYR